MESAGTVLSTNWTDVGKRKVDMNPPDDVDYKKYWAPLSLLLSASLCLTSSFFTSVWRESLLPCGPLPTPQLCSGVFTKCCVPTFHSWPTLCNKSPSMKNLLNRLICRFFLKAKGKSEFKCDWQTWNSPIPLSQHPPLLCSAFPGFLK